MRDRVGRHKVTNCVVGLLMRRWGDIKTTAIHDVDRNFIPSRAHVETLVDSRADINIPNSATIHADSSLE